MLTDNTRYQYMASFGYATLQNLFLEDYGPRDCLREIFMASEITPDILLSVAKSPHLTAGGINEQIYNDILFALYYEMRDNRNSKVFDALYNVSMRKYKGTKVMEVYEQLLNQFRLGKDAIAHYGGANNKSHQIMFYWMLYEEASYGTLIEENMKKEYKEMMRNELAHDKESFCIDATFLFDDDTNILESNNYKRFYQQVTDELVNHINTRFPGCGATNENFTEIIAKHVHFGMHLDTKAMDIVSDEPGDYESKIYNNISFLGQQNYNFSIDLISAIMGDINMPGMHLLDYHPDIHEIIDLIIKSHLYRKTVHGETLSRGELNRVIKPAILNNMDAFYESIVYLYYIDCLFKALESMRDFYYYSFSWFYDIDKNSRPSVDEKTVESEDIHNGKVVRIVPDTASEQHNDAKDYHEELQKRYEFEHAKFLSVGQRFQHEINEKDREIDKKDKKIEELEDRLRTYQEYIELITSDEEEDYQEPVDISKLYNLRFLFVGKVSEIYPELKRMFQKSVFMESETTNINSVKVDAVVFFIKHMGHSMYDKVTNRFRGSDIPFIYCNTKNLNNVYADMYRSLVK